MSESKSKTGYFAYADCILKADLVPHAKMILFVIANHYNWKTKTPTWVSNSTIAKESGLSVSSVKRYLKALMKDGWLTHAGYKAITNGVVNQFRPSTPSNDLSHGSNTQAGGSNEDGTWVKWDSDLNHKQITNIEIYRTKKKEQLNNNASTKFSLPPLRWLRKKEKGN